MMLMWFSIIPKLVCLAIIALVVFYVLHRFSL